MILSHLKSKTSLFIAGMYFSFAGTDDQVDGLLPALALCGEF
jgi:hypothetical protein